MRTLFIILLAIFVAVDIGLLCYLFWPGSSNPKSRQAEEKQLQQNEKLVQSQVAPLRGIDKKLVDVRAAIKKFDADHVPAYQSVISSELHKLEQENGVSEQGVHYATEDAGIPGIERLKVDTGVAGDYLKIAHFINALERDKLLFLIHQITVSGQPAGTVELQIKFETFLKGAA
jgi:type IV pilus assembly protein PilO